jgi:acyl-coenzyme A thioesterase PaaI-like protein
VCGLQNDIGLQLRFYNHEDREIVANCIISPKYQGYPGIVHGGIVAAMLDEAAGRSQMIRKDENGEFSTRFLFTARIDIRYRKIVPVGEPLHLVGRPGKTKGGSARATALLYDQAGDVLAEADVLLMDVPEGLINQDNLEALGWKIYPEGAVES